MSKANDIQVGGTHYRNADQHWDLAAECELGYFEGQITKYVTRHRFKKGLEDAHKAKHFVLKLRELAQAGKRPQSTGVTTERIERFALANNLREDERDILYAAINWSEPFVLGYCLHQLDLLIGRVYPPADTADAAAEAGAGYVNQD